MSTDLQREKTYNMIVPIEQRDDDFTENVARNVLTAYDMTLRELERDKEGWRVSYRRDEIYNMEHIKIDDIDESSKKYRSFETGVELAFRLYDGYIDG